MKMIKKVSYVFLCAVLFCGVLAAFSGCGENENSEKYSIKMTSAAEIFEEDTLSLNAKLYKDDKETVGEITYLSSNEAVATVDASGKVYCVAAGNVVITAAYSADVTATCNIKVKALGYYPSLKLNTLSTLQLIEAAEYDIVANMEYRGETIALDGETISWDVSDKAVISATESNGMLSIKALKKGKSVITTTVVYKNETFVKSVTVTVIEEGTSFELSEKNENTSLESIYGAYRANLVTYSYSGENSTEIEVLPEVIIGGESRTNPTVVWETSDNNIVVVTNGKVTAKSAGKAVVTANYTEDGIDYIQSIDITVSKEKIVKSGLTYFADKDSDTGANSNIEIKIEPVLIAEEKIEKFYLDGVQIGTATITNTNVTVDKQYLAKGSYTIVVETNFGYHEQKIVYCDYKISTKEQFIDIRNVRNRIVDPNGQTDSINPNTKVYSWHGYFALAADIDFEGGDYEDFCGYGRNGESWQGFSGFRGTFDGCGYSIKNIKLVTDTSGGLFGLIGTDGVVKNLNVINVDNVSQSGVIATFNWGTISNVFISGSFSKDAGATEGSSMLVGKQSTGGKINNVFVHVTGAPEEMGKYTGLVCRQAVMPASNIIVVADYEADASRKKLFGEGINSAVILYETKEDYQNSTSYTNFSWAGWELADGEDYPKYVG